jgi:RNA polymerase sigma-70 factor, ECF subfamily
LTVPPGDSSIPLPLLATAGTQRARKASPLETEVVGLFDQLRDRLLRYVLGFGVSAADGEEIIQDVFLALFVHLDRGGAKINLRAWVFRVAHNQALKRREAALRMPEIPEGGRRDRRVDPAPNPEDRLAGRERQERLQAVLRVLPEQDRECLCLRAEGLRYREIAEVLGISLGGVANSLARSLARLAREDER